MVLTSFAGGSIFGRRHGGGSPGVVALHGWGRRSDDFSALLAGIDAVALDLPGFGASPAPQEAMGAAGYADAVLPVLRSLSSPPIVVGHSFGGRVAVCLAAAHPDLVRGLVLTGVPLVRRHGGRRPSWTYRMLRSAHRMHLISDARMEAVRRRRGSPDYRAASGVMRDVLVMAVNESYEDQLAGLRVPVRMVWGEDDRETPVDIARVALGVMLDAGVDARLDVISGAGHFLPVERPETVRPLIEPGEWR